MSTLANILIHILANCAAILVAAKLVPGFHFYGNWSDLAIAGLVLGIVNSFIRPIVKLLTFPLIILTLGIFAVIINIALLFLVSALVPNLVITGFWAAFWGVIIISLVNHFILSIAHKKED